MGGILLVVAVVLCLPASCGLAEYQCTTRAEKMGLRGDWGPVQGCMVQTKERWLPIEAIREVDP